MTQRSIEAVSRMLIALAAVPDDEQLDVVAQVVKTWLERDDRWSEGRRRLWRAAVRGAGG